MIKDYEDFKKFILSLTTIDLNAYKEKQMKRRIDTLIARHKYDGYDSYCKAIKEDTGLREEFVNYITINVSEYGGRQVYLNFIEIRICGRHWKMLYCRI